MTTTKFVPPTAIAELSCAAVDAKPRDYTFDAKNHVDYGDVDDGWEIALEVTEEEHDADPDAWCPMMNYAYPLPHWRGDSDGAKEAFAHLPLTVVRIGGETYLALTGGGMDLSWEICEGYMRLGYLPPAHFADLPAMAGRGASARDLWIVDGCRRSLEVAMGWLKRRDDSLVDLVQTARADARASARVPRGKRARHSR